MTFPDRFPILHSERLLLRETAVRDAEGVFAMESDPVAMRSAQQSSLRALERLGFQREGLLRERWQVGDEISDTVLLGLLAREWAARKQVS